MATVIQITGKDEKVTQVTFASDSGKQYQLTLYKETGKAIVETAFIHHMNYGHEKEGFAYKVFNGTIAEIKKTSMKQFISQFK